MVDEDVLHRLVGGPEVMAEQCERWSKCTRSDPMSTSMCVPASAGAYAGLAGPFILAKGRDFETAHIDNSLQADVVDRHDSVDRLVRKWEAIRSEALPRTQSRELIKEVATRWQT